MIITTSAETRVESWAMAGHNETDDSLFVLTDKLQAFRDRVALSIFEGGRWHQWTYADLALASRILGGNLLGWGLEPGDRVAILSESRPEWAVAFFGSHLAGAVVVPLDPKLSPAELTEILEDCRPRVIFASSACLETAKGLAAATVRIRMIAMDAEADTGDALALGKLNPPAAKPKFRRRSGTETALIVYTSGTSGRAKGVRIGISNLLFQVRSLEKAMAIRERSVFLSVLPLNHLLEFAAGFLGVLHGGHAICYAPSPYPADLIEAMRARRVTTMITVPLFLRMLKENIEREARRKGKGATLNFALALSPWLPVAWRRRVFRSVHNSLGGCLREFICGGAPLDPGLERFFDALGIPVFQGYGLTETSPVVSLNTPLARKVGTVGHPLPEVQVKIRRGEILTRGPHVMKGYYGREDLTREVVDEEGWFATGDLGSLDTEGFLRITGRAKSMIVLGSGKKVQPEEVEAALSLVEEVEEVCVLGKVCPDGPNRGNEEIVAVAAPSKTLLEKYPDGGWEEPLRRAVALKSAELSAFKRPSRVVISKNGLPKTSTRKIKRAEVLRWLEGK